MSSKTFKKTGRNVQIPRTDLINMTIDQLATYDSMPPAQRAKTSDPYSDPVHVTMSDGKTVQVPRYIQQASIVKWDILKKRSATVNGVRGSGSSGAHTRLANRERYSGKDPYVMNRELQGVEGADDDGQDMDEFNDFPVDKELAKLREYERTRKRAVGRADVPDNKYGRGGSYGDLPRDFDVFSRSSDRDIDDTTYVRDDPERRGQIEPSGFHDIYDANSLSWQTDYDTQARQRVGQRRPVGRPREDRGVVGIESDIQSEEHTSGGIAETHVEQYAPVDDSSENDEQPDDYNESCTSCPRTNDARVYQSQDRLESEQDEYDYGNDEYDYGNDEYDNEEIESYDSDTEYVDHTYKYLFFILLFLIVFLVLNYKRNNGTGLGF